MDARFLIGSLFWSLLLFTIVLSAYGIITRSWQALAIGAGLSVLLGLVTFISIGPYILILAVFQGFNAWRIYHAQHRPPTTG